MNLIDQWIGKEHIGKEFIVFDTETNGFDASKHSLLSVAAIKYKFTDNNNFEKLDSFQRFYFPIEPYNEKAIKINKLTKEAIEESRVEDYPLFFKDDNYFRNFCQGLQYVVAHNINFDISFVPFLKRLKLFDTMLSNTDIVKCEWNENKNDWKWPTLNKTARFYNINFPSEKFHDALFDVLITTEILRKMLCL